MTICVTEKKSENQIGSKKDTRNTCICIGLFYGAECWDCCHWRLADWEEYLELRKDTKLGMKWYYGSTSGDDKEDWHVTEM